MRRRLAVAFALLLPPAPGICVFIAKQIDTAVDLFRALVEKLLFFVCLAFSRDAPEVIQWLIVRLDPRLAWTTAF
jgi:hypothetical protein